MSTFKYRVMTRGSGVLEGKRASVSKAELLDYLKKSGHIVLKVEEIGGQKAGKLFSNLFLMSCITILSKIKDIIIQYFNFF